MPVNYFMKNVQSGKVLAVIDLDLSFVH